MEIAAPQYCPLVAQMGGGNRMKAASGSDKLPNAWWRKRTNMQARIQDFPGGGGEENIHKHPPPWTLPA